MTNTPKLKLVKSGLRVYIDGIAPRCRLWAEPTLNGTYLVRVQSHSMTLAQRLAVIENARHALKQRNGGRDPKTMQDVLALLHS